MSLAEQVAELDRDLLAFIEQGAAPRPSGDFDRLALRVFALQYNNIPLYRRFCDRRGLTPTDVESWEQIPAMPTDAFKAADLVLWPEATVRIFETSGTSSAAERGRVAYDAGGLKLMDATIRAAGARFLFPDGLRPTILVLAPSPELAPHMIMVYGMNRLIEYFGGSSSRFLVGRQGFDAADLVRALEKAAADERPVALCGGSFGFVNFFDYCRQRRLRFALPKGSRCLDAGGFKGKSREIDRATFEQYCGQFLSIPASHCVNLLGMTETASQFYDNTLWCHYNRHKAPKAKVNPPWTRTLVVDADSLVPLASGSDGLLRHFDLANRGHLCALQSDDLGRLVSGGFEVYGRAAGGEARGCALTIDELTRIAEDF
jgi:hypothetical protein